MSVPPDTDISASSNRETLLAREVRAQERIALLIQIAMIAAAAGLVIVTLGEVVMIVFAAVLAAVMLRGAASWLGRVTRIGTGWGLAVVIVLLIAFFGGLGRGFGPSLVHQANQLQEVAGQQFAAMRAQMATTEWGRSLLHQLPFGLGQDADAPAPPAAQSGSGGIGSVIPHLAGIVAGALWSALGLVGTMTVILAAAIYLAASPATYVQGLARLLPARLRPETRRVLGHVGQALRGWLIGQFLDMLIVGTLCGAGLALLGVPLAFILAVIAGLTNFVPYVGAIAGAVPAVLIAFSLGGQVALDVALLYLGVQTLEGNVIAPLIQSRTVDLPPALTIVAQTALGLIFGLFGVMLATPLTAAIIAAVQEVTDDDMKSDDERVAAPYRP